MQKINLIAIDGPAGTGKSTVAKLVAEKLGWQYIDSGAMYRAVTYKCIENNNDFHKDNIIKIANKINIKLNKDKVFVDGLDVSKKIRSIDVTSKVSAVACIPEVRESLVSIQKLLGQKTPSVMEGRDIGSIVFPNAKYKIYLDASVDIRAKRRFNEIKSTNPQINIDDIKKAIIERDNNDFNREFAPLVKMPDAKYIDTTNLTINQVVDEIINYVR